MSNLNAQKALIFRITHVSNVAWILDNGLHCSNSTRSDPNYIPIGNSELIARRTKRTVPIAPGGTLSDYIPFYFTPYSPMLLNIKTGYNGITKRPMDEIAIIVSSLRDLESEGLRFVFTDRHAYLETAEFYSNLEDLDSIDWAIIQARDFQRDPDDPGKFERYQAEALVHKRIPVNVVKGIVFHCEEQQRKIEKKCDSLRSKVEVLCKPGWYL